MCECLVSICFPETRPEKKNIKNERLAEIVQKSTDMENRKRNGSASTKCVRVCLILATNGARRFLCAQHKHMEVRKNTHILCVV